MNKKNPKLTYKKVFQFPQDTHDFIEGPAKIKEKESRQRKRKE